MKILLVEDTRSVAAVIEAFLTFFGYEVCMAENGQVAVEKFRDWSPDLVLMDIEMPVMNGFEATTRIRAIETTRKWAWTPIIFLTASDTPENLITAIEAGGDDFLAKGLSEEVLHAKMKAMERIAAMRRMLSSANLKLEQLASRDGLTGLFNRRWMDINVDMAWSESGRKKESLAILMIDVDHFKKYNDYYGHLAGDDCLRAIAQSMEEVITGINADGISTGAFAARYGGEEFAVIIPDTSIEAAKICATRVLDGVRRLEIPHEQNGGWGIVTVSIGGCCRSASTNVLTKIFRDADAALYRAKESGRNHAIFSE